jgi:hypothetical protein
MVNQNPSKAIAQLKPRARDLVVTIRKAAMDSFNVSFNEHALDRMEERDITTMDVLRVLRTGDIDEDIQAGRTSGEWKCKLVARKKGSRSVGVATVVLRSGRLFLKTVEWEDR